uniref:Uncharacterized protein n=1 Tax=Strombidium inclinatum TaxID=197538 RepID=A0A7S3IIR2_9SPIT|mmetsp:Transcript_21171/g.32811  ORF Transcript_21171/g.32811 Transcript_21171/m.32811 type:complete len:125 (+) Transcript_21171:539-913(+)
MIIVEVLRALPGVLLVLDNGHNVRASSFPRAFMHRVQGHPLGLVRQLVLGGVQRVVGGCYVVKEVVGSGITAQVNGDAMLVVRRLVSYRSAVDGWLKMAAVELKSGGLKDLAHGLLLTELAAVS